MQAFWEVVLDSLIDTAKVVPILFVVYYIIEILEYKNAIKVHHSSLLNGKASPVAGALVGSIPQCGFSVVTTDLFNKGSVSVGALIAVYIATSDEAIPLMFANIKTFPMMMLLIGIKIVYAIIIGYIAGLLFKLMLKKELKAQNTAEHQDHDEELQVHGGCCHHEVESKSFDWQHPLFHCVKIALFILFVNILFGCLTDIWIGEERLNAFLNGSKFLQPILAVLIGLIPNCASSVVITELYIAGGLKFGAMLAGLCVNAGLGLVILLRGERSVKVKAFVLSVLIVSAIAIGYALIWI